MAIWIFDLHRRGQWWSGLVGDDFCWLLGGVAERLGGGRWMVGDVSDGHVDGLFQGGSRRVLEVWRGHDVVVVVGTWGRSQWDGWGVYDGAWGGDCECRGGGIVVVAGGSRWRCWNLDVCFWWYVGNCWVLVVIERDGGV